ncbi:MAG: nucleotidyl transferase AbiEii/AbiGii toxin family protein [Nanoarchaeota archaeon]
MDLLQLREKEIFEALKGIIKCKFTVIGGYSVNAYTLPRFSVDCDIVVEDKDELKKIEKNLASLGYEKGNWRNNLAYHGEFIRYEKELQPNFKVSMDILFNKIIDRQTNSAFDASWVFKNSKIRQVKGKTIPAGLRLRVINIDALIAMKIISCRITDIRDVFMLMPKAGNIEWIKQEVMSRCDFQNRFSKIKDKVSSGQFKDNLQGIYGRIDNALFEKHKKSVLSLND